MCARANPIWPNTQHSHSDREGAISIEDGSGLVSVLEVVEGMQFDRGFLSPSFMGILDHRDR